MDALELLTQDHRKVKDLFAQAKKLEDKRQLVKLFKEIRNELDIHMRIEESIFYPAVKEHEELREMVLESIEEHRQVKTLLRELGKLSAGSEKFKPKLKVMADNIEHHAEEEEEQKMFPKVRQAMETGELAQLGHELEAAKRKRVRRAG